MKSDGLEKSRVYGRVYVAPIQTGHYPPVCVTKKIIETSHETNVNAMRDPMRPSIIVFCKEIASKAKPLFTALGSVAAFGELPVFVTVTGARGVAEDASGHFKREHYYDEKQAHTEAERLMKQAISVGLASASVGLAVNRFWREEAGYTSEKDILVAYVRGRVLLLEKLCSSRISEKEAHALLQRLGEKHREKRP